MNVEAVRETFTKWAPYYDATHRWTLPKRREAQRALDLRPGERVLDVACGTGLNLPSLRKAVGERGRVIGVDLTPAMLDIARRLIEKNAWINVEVRQADASELPFPDASFEKVICSFALSIIPKYVQALEEISRVLVPGGRFVSLEMEMKVHRLPIWMQPIPHLCAVDVSHDTSLALRHVFPGVRERRYWMGMIVLAEATKA